MNGRTNERTNAADGQPENITQSNTLIGCKETKTFCWQFWRYFTDGSSKMRGLIIIYYSTIEIKMMMIKKMYVYAERATIITSAMIWAYYEPCIELRCLLLRLLDLLKASGLEFWRTRYKTDIGIFLYKTTNPPVAVEFLHTQRHKHCLLIKLILGFINKYVSPPYCRDEMHAGRVVCCPLVSPGESPGKYAYADETD